jgi:hypothetical protein
LNSLSAAAFAVTAAVAVEIALPGESVYHTGWYNVLLAALIVVAVVVGRRQFARTHSSRARAGIAIVLAGTAIVGIAGVVSGLLAPDNQTVVGAPGQRSRIESLGTILFPIATSNVARADSVVLDRPLHAPVEIGERSRPVGAFMLHTQMRSVVYVEARDLRGNRLTITQPEGTTFLSPVLLMQHRQTIAGMDLPFDSFNVPAARRVVKAVMFTPAQAAMLLRNGARLGEPAVLFAVDDENDRPLKNGIGLSAGGRPMRAGGLILRGYVADYPALEAVAIPNIFATAFGTLLVLGGAVALLAGHDRSNVSQDDAAL